MEAAAPVGLFDPTVDVIAFTVPGKAEPAGSKRAFYNHKLERALVVDDNAKSRPWKSAVAAEGALAMLGGEHELITGPIKLELVFNVVRPKGHFRTGRNSHLVRDSAPSWPTTKPDVLKLARGVEDALTGICWRDDAQIVSEHLLKRYASHASCTVLITEMT